MLEDWGGWGGMADWALRWAALRWLAGRVAFVLRAVFSTSAFMRDRVLLRLRKVDEFIDYALCRSWRYLHCRTRSRPVPPSFHTSFTYFILSAVEGRGP